MIAAARCYLTELERERAALRNSISTQSQLPLFTFPRTQSHEPVRPALSSPVLAALRAVDPNGLTPREALDLLFRLRELDSSGE